jgi:hypothetical protein
MKFKTSILLFIIAFSVNAQVAGYMGKKFSIGYSNYFFPGLKGPGPREAELSDEQSPCFNTTHSFNIEYSVRPRTNFCFSVQYLKTGIANLTTDRYSNGYGYPYPGNARYIGDPSVPVQLSSLNFAIGLKFFKKGFVAPIGRYRKLEVLLLSEKVKYDNHSFVRADSYNYPYSEIPYVAGTGEYDYQNIAFAYTIGKQRAIADVIVLDYGIRFGILPGGVFAMAGSGSYSSDISMEQYFRRTSWARLYRQQLINFHIGINFLAF